MSSGDYEVLKILNTLKRICVRAYENLPMIISLVYFLHLLRREREIEVTLIISSE